MPERQTQPDPSDVTIAPASRKRHPGLRFSLRLGLALVAVLGVGLAWCANQMYLARQQKRALDALTKIDASGQPHVSGIQYDWESIGYKSPPAPPWLLPLCGQDLFGNVLSVTATSAFSDDDVAQLSGFGELRFLNLSDSKITDAGLCALRPLSKLHDLKLANTAIGDEGARSLRKFPTLRDLDLSGANVGDAGVAGLAALMELRELDLWGTRVTDASMATLASLEDLNTLDLRNTEVTDAGAATLGRAPRLCYLQLDFPLGRVGLAGLAKSPRLSNLCLGQEISDTDLALLKGNLRITSLELRCSQVTDAGLKTLETMPNLSWLNEVGISLTAERRRQLWKTRRTPFLFLIEHKLNPHSYRDTHFH